MISNNENFQYTSLVSLEMNLEIIIPVRKFRICIIRHFMTVIKNFRAESLGTSSHNTVKFIS